MMNAYTPLAHAAEDGRTQPLIDHLRGVAQRAERFTRAFQAPGWGATAGWWHDIGKFSGDFQALIHGTNGIDAHIETEGGPRDHSTAGALLAAGTFEGDHGHALAFCIAGHHAGLCDAVELLERLQRKAGMLDAVLAREPPAEVLEPVSMGVAWPSWVDQPSDSGYRLAFDLFVRLLFSSLVDADFLDTEEFFQPARQHVRRGFASLAELRSKLDVYLEAKAKDGSGVVHAVRQDVRRSCEAASDLPPGAFSLTVPTGGGKTLASMAFALRHAERHGLERVLVAIPFTSIIEQTAEEYRKIFGAENVIEHHSAIDAVLETPRNRLASENWEAPIIVTTTVQLFESLLANRPSKVRKLHSLVRSVIVLDEAQVVPPKLLPPIVDVLAGFVRNLGTSVVLSTATQPAWTRASLPDGAPHFDDTREICAPDLCLAQRLRRVRTTVLGDEPIPFAQLAPKIAEHRSSLTIVHRRADARDLCQLVDGAAQGRRAVHLSALMTPAHRSDVVRRLKERLRTNEPTICVATQLVEAGVDIDFPVVFRALAGIDALTQAAGRCNREGLLDSGQLFIFRAESEPPPGVLRTALSVTNVMREAAHAAGEELDLFAERTHAEYFRRLYTNVAMQAGQEIQDLRSDFKFAEVARSFRLIEGDMTPVVVALRVRGEAVANGVLPGNEVACRAVDELATLGPTRARIRALQRFVVNLPRRVAEEAVALRVIHESVRVVERPDAYHARFGLLPERLGEFEAEDFIV